MNIKLLIPLFFIITSCNDLSTKTESFNKIIDSTTVENVNSISEVNTEISITDTMTFEILHNIEMGEFCLPYPLYYMDFEQQDYHGQNKLVCKNKKGKMVLQFLFTETTLDTIYENTLKILIPENYPNASIALKMRKANFFVISWSQNGRIYYKKKWYTKDKGIVEAYFEYDKSEKEIFDVIINTVTKADPEACN